VTVYHVAGLRVGIAGPVPGALDPFHAVGLDCDVEIEVTMDPGRAPGAGTAPGVRCSREGQRLFYEGAGSAGTVDLAGRRGEFATFPGSEHLDGFLRFLLCAMLLDRGGLLLHGAGAVRAGRGYAFLGPSGAGKSTLADLAEESGARVLGDEVVAIRRAGEEALICGTPFGSRGRRAGTPGEAPLAAICALEKAPVHEFRPHPRVATARLLLAHAILDPAAAAPGALLDAALDLAGRAAGGTLAFERSAGFWGVLP
jgi:hypothetical protein